MMDNVTMYNLANTPMCSCGINIIKKVNITPKKLIHKFLNECIHHSPNYYYYFNFNYLPILLSIVKQMILLQCDGSKIFAKLLGFWRVLGLLLIVESLGHGSI
jgi:hypothetical protein